MKKYNKIPSHIKALACEMFMNLVSIKDISKTLDVNYNSVCHIIGLYLGSPKKGETEVRVFKGKV